MDDTEEVITVAVVDDHEMVAEMLATVLGAEAGVKFVGWAASSADALLLVERERPQVVLLDYRLPDSDGIAVVRKILSIAPATHVVMLSGSGESDLLARAVEAGCVGLINKDRPVQAVIAAVRSAARGELVIQSDQFASLLGRLRNPVSQASQWLTARELEVLQLLAKGRATDAIAGDLFISINTVRNHVSNILNKLGAHSKLEAVAIAARDKLISLDGTE